MEAHDFQLIKVPLLALKSLNINVSLSAAPKLALVPANRYYCDVIWSYHNVCATMPFLARKPVNFKVSRSAARN